MLGPSSDVENVRVLVRLRPLQAEEINNGESEIFSIDGKQNLTIFPQKETVQIALPKTPMNSKHCPPKTPKVKNALKKNLFSSGKNEEVQVNSSVNNANVDQDLTFESPSSSSPENLTARRFAFDRIYGPESSQKDVYAEINDFVESVTEGYNATVFAYGQTGAGKTYTMSGTSKEPGIIPRAVNKLFSVMEGKKDFLFVVQLTYVELYMDQFVDLLDPDLMEGVTKRKKEPVAIRIREDDKKNVTLSGGTTIRMPVKDAAEAMDLINRGTLARKTAQTKLNSNSSRSHSILIVTVESRDDSLEESPIHVGKLSLVDLAGSENISKEGEENDTTYQEALAINSSLTALGDVLQSLSSKTYNGPIPYRNSKLTRLLQDSLGGNTKTFFIVNVPCGSGRYEETMLSLMYGQRTKRIKNIVSQNRDTDTEADNQHLYLEIEDLRSRLIQKSRELDQIREMRENSNESNRKMNEKMKELDKNMKKEAERAEEERRESEEELELQISAAELEKVRAQRNLQVLKKEMDRLKLELLNENDAREAMEQSLIRSRKESQDSKTKLKSLREEKVNLEKENKRNEKELDLFQRRSNEMEEKIRELEDSLESFRNKQGDSSAREKELEKKVKDLDASVKRFKSSEEKHKEEKGNLDTEISLLKKKVKELEGSQRKSRENEEKSLEIKASNEENEKLKREMRELERNNSKDSKRLQEKIDRLESEIKESKRIARVDPTESIRKSSSPSKKSTKISSRGSTEVESEKTEKKSRKRSSPAKESEGNSTGRRKNPVSYSNQMSIEEDEEEPPTKKGRTLKKNREVEEIEFESREEEVPVSKKSSKAKEQAIDLEESTASQKKAARAEKKAAKEEEKKAKEEEKRIKDEEKRSKEAKKLREAAREEEEKRSREEKKAKEESKKPKESVRKPKESKKKSTVSDLFDDIDTEQVSMIMDESPKVSKSKSTKSLAAVEPKKRKLFNTQEQAPLSPLKENVKTSKTKKPMKESLTFPKGAFSIPRLKGFGIMGLDKENDF